MAAIFIMSNSIRNEDPRKLVMLAMGIAGIVIIFVTVVRDMLRTAYLSPYFKAGELATKPNWMY